MAKITKELNPYDSNWTPLFDDLPKELKLSDRAVYGNIKRRCEMYSRMCTASANTIALQIGTSESTVNRSLNILEKFGLIKCEFRGKLTRTPSHYVVMPRKLWKTLGSNCVQTRVNLHPTGVNLTYKETEDTNEDTVKNSNLKVNTPSVRTSLTKKTSNGRLLRAAAVCKTDDWDGNIQIGDGENLYEGMEAE